MTTYEEYQKQPRALASEPDTEKMQRSWKNSRLIIGHEENLTRLQNELLNKDWFMTLLDFKAYTKKKEEGLEAYEDRKTWAKKMIVNIAKAGYFSSDRTIAEYNNDIWHA